jgi:hypothetical protein
MLSRNWRRSTSLNPYPWIQAYFYMEGGSLVEEAFSPMRSWREKDGRRSVPSRQPNRRLISAEHFYPRRSGFFARDTE